MYYYYLIRMSTTAAEIATLEYTSVKVPYEILNKKFRHAQKIIDRDISHLQSGKVFYLLELLLITDVSSYPQ